MRQGKGTEIFNSGAKYTGEYYHNRMNGQGAYVVPPIEREERIRTYKYRLIIQAERMLIEVDAALDNGLPDVAKGTLKVAGELYAEAGYLTPPRGLVIKSMEQKLKTGYISAITTSVERATAAEKRSAELEDVRKRVEAAVQAIRDGEDMDPILKRLREEREMRETVERARKEEEEEERQKLREAEIKAEAEAIADMRMQAKRDKKLKEVELANKAKGVKGPAKLPFERPETLKKARAEELARAMEEVRKREAKKALDEIERAEAQRAADYEVQVRELSNGSYIGHFLDGSRHGYGIRVYGNGDRYAGGWKAGRKYGYGELTYHDGSSYVGPFLNGVYHGKGKLVLKGFATYVGMFVNGRQEGYGEQTFVGDASLLSVQAPHAAGIYTGENANGKQNDKQNASKNRLLHEPGAHADGSHGATMTSPATECVSTYKGEYWDGKPHGFGTRVFKSGAVYTGQFRWGLFDGRGTYTYEDTSVYDGMWHADMRHGYGVWQCVRGDRYAGIWDKDTAMCGHGVRLDRITKSVYSGDIRAGTYHGYGFYRDGTTGETYEGEWRAGKRQGTGKAHGCPDTGGPGSRFEGQWDSDRPVTGFGKMVYKDGSWYVGAILKVFRHGAGVMSYANGDMYDGEWKSDMRHGHGCMVKGRKVYSGPWCYNETGMEEPLWQPFQDDSYVDREVDRDALRRMAQLLSCNKGRVQIIHALMQRDDLRVLVRGTLYRLRRAYEVLVDAEAQLLRDATAAVDVKHVGRTGQTHRQSSRKLVANGAKDAHAHSDTQRASSGQEHVDMHGAHDAGTDAGRGHVGGRGDECVGSDIARDGADRHVTDGQNGDAHLLVTGQKDGEDTKPYKLEQNDHICHSTKVVDINSGRAAHAHGHGDIDAVEMMMDADTLDLATVRERGAAVLREVRRVVDLYAWEVLSDDLKEVCACVMVVEMIEKVCPLPEYMRFFGVCG
jgi:hypothetical protein